MQSSIKRVYKPYWTWECYKSGMWRKVDNKTYKEMLKKAILFTSDYQNYGKAMTEVVFKWENSMKHNLTNTSLNKKAYVGHCAACYKLSIPEYITRHAWKYLTKKQQYLANNEAEKTILEWKKQYIATLNNGKKDVIKKEYQMKLPLKFIN